VVAVAFSLGFGTHLLVGYLYLHHRYELRENIFPVSRNFETKLLLFCYFEVLLVQKKIFEQILIFRFAHNLLKGGSPVAEKMESHLK
jgi:hypothetical protein